MIYTEYPKIIEGKSEYRTEKKSHSFLPALRFYPKLIKVVFEANRKAVKGLYDGFNHSYASLKIMRALERVGVEFEVKGLNNIRKSKEPAVFIGNHMGTLETMGIEVFIYPIKPVIYIIKQELIDYPLFGKVVGANHQILVTRKNPREDLLTVFEEGKKRLEDGYSIIIFPQKTREIFLNIKQFNTLGVKLAQKNNADVIPFAVKTDAWANGKWIKDFGKIDPSRKVKIEFGEPFKVENNTSEAHKRTLDFIESRFIEWGMEKFIIK